MARIRGRVLFWELAASVDPSGRLDCWEPPSHEGAATLVLDLREACYADGEGRKDLLHRDADEGCAGVGGFLSAGVWMDDSHARRWRDGVRRHDGRGKRRVCEGASSGGDARGDGVHHGVQRGGGDRRGEGEWRGDW